MSVMTRDNYRILQMTKRSLGMTGEDYGGLGLLRMTLGMIWMTKDD